MKKYILLILSILCGISVSAQPSAWRDTLQAAVKTDTRRIELGLGRLRMVCRDRSRIRAA